MDALPPAYLPQKPQLINGGSTLIDQDSKPTLVGTHDEG
jgi:hypothetical protein